MEPETMEPETMEPETMEPETMEPETMEPETMEPETMEPETMEPETMEPETIEPEPMEPVGEERTQYDSEGRDISWRWTRGISSRPSGEQTAHHSSSAVPPSGETGNVPEAPSPCVDESDKESGNEPEGPSQSGEERDGKSGVRPDITQASREDDMGGETGNEPELQSLPFDKDKGGTAKNGSRKDRVDNSGDMPDSESPIRDNLSGHDLTLMPPLEVGKTKFPKSPRRHSKSPRKALQNNGEKSPSKGDGWYNRSTYGCNRCSVTTSTRRGMELHMWKAGLPFRFHFIRFRALKSFDPDSEIFCEINYYLIFDQITITTPNPKCRLYWCLIEFIDWRDPQSCCYFRPLL